MLKVEPYQMPEAGSFQKVHIMDGMGFRTVSVEILQIKDRTAIINLEMREVFTMPTNRNIFKRRNRNFIRRGNR